MRDINQLHPELISRVYELIELCSKNGISIGISECLRTTQEQDALYAKGRTAPGNRVTNCKGSTYSSMHQWGVAFDFYLKMDVDGDGFTTDDAYNNSTGLFTKVGELGKSIGLEWGGDWKSIKDMPHFQLPTWGSTASKLKTLYGTPEMFITTWSKPSGQEPQKDTMSPTISGSGRVTAVSGVKIRSTPSALTSSNRIGTIPYKATCEILKLDVAETSGVKWAHIIYNGVRGYVAQKYIDIIKYPASSDVVMSASDESGNSYTKLPVRAAASRDVSYSGKYSVKSNLNLRTGPGTHDTGIISTIPKGNSVQNYGYYTLVGDAIWLLVSYGKYTGYVHMGYLTRM